jgi:hypothetical protein
VLVNGTLILRLKRRDRRGVRIRIAEIVAAEPMGAPDVDGATLALFARLIVSLGVVIGLMWVRACAVRLTRIGGVVGGRRDRGAGRRDRPPHARA